MADHPKPEKTKRRGHMDEMENKINRPEGQTYETKRVRKEEEVRTKPNLSPSSHATGSSSAISPTSVHPTVNRNKIAAVTKASEYTLENNMAPKAEPSDSLNEVMVKPAEPLPRAVPVERAGAQERFATDRGRKPAHYQAKFSRVNVDGLSSSEITLVAFDQPSERCQRSINKTANSVVGGELVCDDELWKYVVSRIHQKSTITAVATDDFPLFRNQQRTDEQDTTVWTEKLSDTDLAGDESPKRECIQAQDKTIDKGKGKAKVKFKKADVKQLPATRDSTKNVRTPITSSNRRQLTGQINSSSLLSSPIPTIPQLSPPAKSGRAQKTRDGRLLPNPIKSRGAQGSTSPDSRPSSKRRQQSSDPTMISSTKRRKTKNHD